MDFCQGQLYGAARQGARPICLTVRGLVWLCLIWMLLPGAALANDVGEAKPQTLDSSVTLNMSPQQCVAMTEGQICYVDVELSWQSSVALDVCLFQSLQKTPLKCWNQAQSGDYEQELATNKNVTFTLRQISDLTLVAQRQLTMAWVHKKRGKPTNWWRIF